MAQLNVTTAAHAAGVSRRTLQRHIAQGKVSYQSGEQGQKLIDTAELVRVYGTLKNPVSSDTQTPPRQMAHSDTPDVALMRQRITALEKVVDGLEQDKQQYSRENEKLLTIVEQQTRLLTYNPPKRSFWVWIGLKRQVV